VVYRPISREVLPAVLQSNAGSQRIDVAAAAARIDPHVRATAIPLASLLVRRFAAPRLTARLAAFLGALALMIASVGLFGVCSFWVQQRTREIGVRIALGARATQIIQFVLGLSARALGAGLAVGFLLALVAARLIRGMLFGLNPLDPLSFAGVAALLAAAGAVAIWWPVRRATRVDPSISLRCD
jgi:ABC-type lipoprotein release transport system permease subunit